MYEYEWGRRGGKEKSAGDSEQWREGGKERMDGMNE